MADHVWVKHPVTAAVTKVPASASVVMAGSGWRRLSRSEAAAQERRVAAERLARGTAEQFNDAETGDTPNPPAARQSGTKNEESD